MELVDRVKDRGEGLTAAERRIAETALARPQVVAFGTVAELAATADVGTATVVRFATKLGYDGFADMQDVVQRDLVGRLRPAAERIHQGEPVDESIVGRHGAIEAANVRASVSAIDEAELRAVVARLANQGHDVLVLSGAASTGVAAQFVGDLSQLRPGVALLDGNEVDVQRRIALATDPSVVALDLRRYDRWLVDALGGLRAQRAWTVAITDSVISPLAEGADHTFIVAAGAAGPFDSHVGTLAVMNVIVAQVAALRRRAAAPRLERIESRWRANGSLTEGR